MTSPLAQSATCPPPPPIEEAADVTALVNRAAAWLLQLQVHRALNLLRTRCEPLTVQPLYAHCAIAEPTLRSTSVCQCRSSLLLHTMRFKLGRLMQTVSALDIPRPVEKCFVVYSGGGGGACQDRRIVYVPHAFLRCVIVTF